MNKVTKRNDYLYKGQDENCTVCDSADCEESVHETWTEFDAELGIWVEKSAENFTGNSISSLTDLMDKDPQYKNTGI